MKKRFALILPLLAVVLLLSSFLPVKTYQEKLIGTWVYDKYDEGTKVLTMKKHMGFKKHAGGYRFMPEGKMVSRSNSSWCGTPPITYKNYEGQWLIKGDTLIAKEKNWNGDVKQEWIIVSLSGKMLAVTQAIW